MAGQGHGCVRIACNQRAQQPAGLIHVVALVGKRDARQLHPGVVGAGADKRLGASGKAIQPLLVFKLRIRKCAGKAHVRAVLRVKVKQLFAQADGFAVASADDGFARLGRNPAIVGSHGDVGLKQGALGGIVVSLRASLLARSANVIGVAGKEVVVALKRVAFGGQLHAYGVVAVRIKGDCLIEQVMALVDELLGMVVVGKGELVVNERGSLCHQMEGAVRIGLGERVAVLREATPKRRKRPRCRGGVLAV